MGRLRWPVACLVLTASVLLLIASPAAAQTADQNALVATYAPHLMLREQTAGDNCNTREEQYNPPTRVEVVLGNPAVKLVHYVNGRDVPVKEGPTASDIAGLGDDYYLDLPGDPLNIKCPAKGSYAKDFQALRNDGKAPAATYAHIATEPGFDGLVVQYWFFYYFNQFNDVHEGDWEGMQISFDADSAAEALRQGPDQIALFQHAGGERADWDDSKVQKDGTHPIVYPAAGSHATFYDDAIYIQNGSHGSGVGCDDTQSPHIESRPTPLIMPTTAARGSEFQWLTYLGHWGQREKGFNNGPQGPTTKSQWLQPFSWMEGIRQDSPKLPGGAILGPAASTAFCGVIENVSEFINLEAKSTMGAIGLALVILLLLVVPPLLTRWRPVDITNLRHRWTFGQLLRGARQLYGRHWPTFLQLAVVGAVILLVFQLVQHFLIQVNGGSSSFTAAVHPFGATLEFSGSFDNLSQPIGFAIVGGAVTAYMRFLVEGEPGGMREAYRYMYGRLGRLVGAELLAIFLAALLVITIIGIPFAFYFYFAWQFVQQEIIFKNARMRAAFSGSHEIVRGHWLRTVAMIGLLTLLAVVAGPILGIFLIFLNFSPVVVNLIGSVVYGLLIPYVAIGRTLLYFDLEAREGEPAREGGLRFPRPGAATSTG
jgi:hypothetical protein